MSEAPRSIRKFLEMMAEMYTEHQLEMIAQCFFMQGRDERRRRLRAIMDLSVERQRLLNLHGRRPEEPHKPQGFQASAFMEEVIKNLIDGNLKEVREYADMYLFKGEEEWAKPWIEVYAKFRAIALAAIAEPGDVQ
jgi:hypothetical protein